MSELRSRKVCAGHEPSARDSQVSMFEDAFVGPWDPTHLYMASFLSLLWAYQGTLGDSFSRDQPGTSATHGGQINGVINNQVPVRRLEGATSVDTRLATTKASIVSVSI